MKFPKKEQYNTEIGYYTALRKYWRQERIKAQHEVALIHERVKNVDKKITELQNELEIQ